MLFFRFFLVKLPLKMIDLKLEITCNTFFYLNSMKMHFNKGNPETRQIFCQFFLINIIYSLHEYLVTSRNLTATFYSPELSVAPAPMITHFTNLLYLVLK